MDEKEHPFDHDQSLDPQAGKDESKSGGIFGGDGCSEQKSLFTKGLKEHNPKTTFAASIPVKVPSPTGKESARVCNDITDLPTNNVAHYVKFFEQQADKKVQNRMAGPTAQPKIQDRPKVLPPTSPAEIPLPPTRKQGPPSVPSLFRNDPKALPSDYVQIFQNEQVSQFKVNSAPLEPFEPIKGEKESPSKAPELVHLYNSKVAVENKQTQTDREPVASLQIQEEPVALSVKQAKPPTERQEQPLPPKASSTVGERIIKCRNGVPESLIKAIRAFIDKQK